MNYLYITIIDYGWEHLRSIEETLKIIADESDSDNFLNEGYAKKKFLKDWDLAKGIAMDFGWEGDFREGSKSGPSVFWLPSEIDMHYGFVFKQNNNGFTFVISPCELPLLKGMEAEYSKIPENQYPESNKNQTNETSLWKELPDSWCCPGCQRKKHQCETKKKDGTSLRWIVSHHDHMADYAKDYIKRKYKNDPSYYFLCQMKDSIKRISKRFNDIPICISCNEIEGALKHVIHADKYFTFDINEIGSAFTSKAFQPHVLKEESISKFRELYDREIKPSIERKKNAIERVIDAYFENQDIVNKNKYQVDK